MKDARWDMDAWLTNYAGREPVVSASPFDVPQVGEKLVIL